MNAKNLFKMPNMCFKGEIIIQKFLTLQHFCLPNGLLARHKTGSTLARARWIYETVVLKKVHTLCRGAFFYPLSVSF